MKPETRRALFCSVCNQPKHTACQCEPPEVREVSGLAALRAPGDYYRVQVRREPPRFFGLVRHGCGTLEIVAACGSLETFRANCVQAIQRGCACRRGFRCNGGFRPREELALAA